MTTTDKAVLPLSKKDEELIPRTPQGDKTMDNITQAMKIIIKDYDTSGNCIHGFDKAAIEQIIGDVLTVPRHIIDRVDKAISEGRCDPQLKESLVADAVLSEHGVDTSYISATEWEIVTD
jgi:hypothetical protein